MEETNNLPENIVPENDNEANPSLYNKIPIRIKSGKITETEMEIITSRETKIVKFEDIDYICLGIIDEKIISSEPPKSGMRNMVRGLFFGKEDSKEKKIQPDSRRTELLDIYVKEQEAPYRIDASAVNYKELLSDISYRSADNFRSLVKSICIKATGSHFNKSLISFITKLKDRQTLFSSTNEFSFTSLKERETSDKQSSWDDIDFNSAPKPNIPDLYADIDGKEEIES